MTERFNSGELKNVFRVDFHKFLVGPTIVGMHAWQQEEEERKGDISTALMIHEQLFISEFFKDIQDAISLILYYRTMLYFSADSFLIFTTSDVHLIFILSSTMD